MTLLFVRRTSASHPAALDTASDPLGSCLAVVAPGFCGFLTKSLQAFFHRVPCRPSPGPTRWPAADRTPPRPSANLLASGPAWSSRRLAGADILERCWARSVASPYSADRVTTPGSSWPFGYNVLGRHHRAMRTAPSVALAAVGVVVRRFSAAPGRKNDPPCSATRWRAQIRLVLRRPASVGRLALVRPGTTPGAPRDKMRARRRFALWAVGWVVTGLWAS